MTTAFAVQEGYRPPQAEAPSLYAVESQAEQELPYPAIPAPRTPEPCSKVEDDATGTLRAIIINETPEDELDRYRAERLVRTATKAGRLALEATTASETGAETDSLPRFPSLAHAIHAAKRGDPIARQFVQANVGTEASEILFKSGHISEVSIFVDENDEHYQYGQLVDEVLVNGLLFASGSAAIKKRTMAEIRNGMRTKSARRAGKLKDHWLVIISRYTDELSDAAAAEQGFFSDSKSSSIQAITELDETELVQQTAFVAGVKNPGEERHDRETAAEMGDRLSINLRGKTDAETIDSAFLVPKSMMPNGVIDLARLWDLAAGGDTFFGENKGAEWANRPTEDYLAYTKQCKQRERDLEHLIQAATDELILNADKLDLENDPDVFVKATELLHDMVDARLIRRAIKEDSTIDARVFGPEAAANIEQGRQRFAQGDIKGAEESAEQAIETSTSSSCPSAREKSDSSKGDSNNEAGKTGERAKNGQNSEVCDIITTSCYCCRYNRDGTKRKTPLRVVAVIDQFETIYCRRDGCGAYMTKGGKIKEKGRIARRGERLAQQQEKQATIAATTPSTSEQVGETEENNVVQFPARPAAAHETATEEPAPQQQAA